MWKAVAFAALYAAGPATYWQANRCHESTLGKGATLKWCVEAAAVTQENALEIHVSWRASGLEGKRLFKGSDAENRRMYLFDDLGRRSDHVATRGAARDGGWLAGAGRTLRGVFVFPAPQPGAKAFRFHDDDQKASIPGITLAPESRTDPAASAALLSGLAESHTLQIDARFGEGIEESYQLRRTPRGFRLENGAGDADAPEIVIPPPVMELFLEGLSESPLLERPYQPKTIDAGDHPATTLDLRTEKDEVFFFSRPAGDRYTPWRAEAGGRTYLVPDDSPLLALEILDPFLGRDPQSRATALLTPRVGAERASDLWAKLEGPLEADEALAVVRRLTQLLERGVEQAEVWQAADEYVLKASPPERETTEVARGEGTKASLGEDLLEAARKGAPEEVRALISAGMDPDARGRDGKTALMLAAEAGRAGAVQALLEAGANPNVQTPGGGTALALAARNQQREAVRLLLQAGANPKLRDAHGVTPLMETVDAMIVRALIRAGADVRAVDDKGLSALLRVVAAEGLRAPSAGRVEAVQSLLTAGADVRARDREGRSALIWAVKGTPSSRSDPALVALLIESGSELEGRDREGGTALVYAAVRGDAKSSRLLVEAGADVNARMGNLSSLDIALRYGHSEIVTLLLRAGARR